MFNGEIKYKWSFSIAMLNYQRVFDQQNAVGLFRWACHKALWAHVPDDIFCWGDTLFFLAIISGHENLETEVSTHLRFT